MSDNINTRLLERASEAMDNCTGTLYAEIIEADIDRNDLESLRIHVKAAEDFVYQENYNPNEALIGENEVY